MMDLIAQVNTIHDRKLDPPDSVDMDIDDALGYIEESSYEDVKKMAYDYFDKHGWEKLADFLLDDNTYGDCVAEWAEDNKQGKRELAIEQRYDAEQGR